MVDAEVGHAFAFGRDEQPAMFGIVAGIGANIGDAIRQGKYALGQLAMELSSTNASANLESLPEGLYLVQLSDPDNVVPDTQKVLIIKH